MKAITISAAVLFLAVTCGRALSSNKHDSSSTGSSSSSKTSASARTSENGCGSNGPTCDAVPKADGMYRVAGSGFFDTGISAGWIATNGPRAGSNHCSWERLSAPIPNDLKFVIDGGVVKASENRGPIYVHIEPTDEAFWSDGCEPWVKISRK